jgi:hypothetical protein
MINKTNIVLYDIAVLDIPDGKIGFMKTYRIFR